MNPLRITLISIFVLALVTVSMTIGWFLLSQTDSSEPIDNSADITIPAESVSVTASPDDPIDIRCSDFVGTTTSSITDISTGRTFEGKLTIESDGNTCTFITNQIPNHNVGEGSRFATPIDEVNTTLEVPVFAREATTSMKLDMGASVILLNGVKWEAYPAACFDVGPNQLGREAIGCHDNELDNPWRYNIGSDLNQFGFDIYNAHVQPNGLYHYHSTPTVLYDIDCDTSDKSSPVIGFASDGFPVFGPCFKDSTGTVRRAESSFQLKDGPRKDIADYTTPYQVGNVKSNEYDGQFIGDFEFVQDSGDLDQCNGMTINDQYGYYVTNDFPYVMRCLSGIPSEKFL